MRRLVAVDAADLQHLHTLAGRASTFDSLDEADAAWDVLERIDGVLEGVPGLERETSDAA